MQEIWKDVVGFEGLYKVSNLGNVKSLRIGKILIPSINRGYKRITLCKNGNRKNKVIHRIVAEAFLDNHKSLTCVNHKDENKLNNCVENLEWCDIKYNTNYGTCIERRSKNNQKPVNQYDLNMNFIKRYESIKEASNGNYSLYTHIGECCKGKHFSIGGYICRYANE